MFGWFKKNQQFIPDDIDKSLLSSIFVEAKLGSKITLPENLICYLCYNDKLYQKIMPGTTVIARDDSELYIKQAHDKRKLKTLKMDLFIANVNVFEFQDNYVDYLNVCGKLTKIRNEYCLKIKLCDTDKFFKFITREYALPNAEDTTNIVLFYIQSHIINFFKHKKFNSSIITEETKKILFDNINKFTQKFGVEILDFQMSITDIVRAVKLTKQKSNFFDNTGFKKPINQEINNQQQPEQDLKTVDSTSKIDYTCSTIKTEDLQKNLLCPKCKHKVIENSAFCHFCGYKLTQINQKDNK